MARKVGPERPERSGLSLVTRTRFIVGSLVVAVVLAIVVPIYYWASDSSSPTGACDIHLSVPIAGAPYRNGSILDHGVLYPKGSYFTDNGTTRGCLCSLRPCIRKCCGRDELIVANGTHPAYCAKNSNDSLFDNFTLPVYANQSSLADVPPNHFRILYGDVCPEGKYILKPWEEPLDQSFLMRDGTVLYAGQYWDATQYCLEEVQDGVQIQTLMCFPPSEDAQTEAMFTFYPVGMILSMPFLLATFLVYAVIPDLRNLHGKSLMCHVASLFTAYLVLTLVQLGRDGISNFWCSTLAFVMQFSFLATFFWLNVMCFDIWWVFSGLRPLRGSVQEREHKKFVFYSLYAWGGPIIIFIISLVMEKVDSIPSSWIRPQFGVNKCWFKESEALLLYFYLPIGVLVFMNIAMFITTAFRLRAHTRDTQVLHGTDSRRTDDVDRQRYNLYLKLFIVMGINWVMELVSFAIQGPKPLWYVTDIGNTLQGLLIFLIFVCKRRILRLLNQRLCPRWHLSPATASRSQVSPSRTSSTNLSKTVSSNPDGLSLKPTPAANGEKENDNRKQGTQRKN